MIIHLNYDAWISANGKTIVERDTWTVLINDVGSRDVGLTVHIQGVGGIVVRDAGQSPGMRRAISSTCADPTSSSPT